MSHTPGPWIASRYGTVFAPGGRAIALASYPEDANLIAASPDLLQFVAEFVEIYQGAEDKGDFAALRDYAVDLLAKAKGELK